MCDPAPETIIGEGALSKETMDMRIPFERSAESMEDTDKAGDKVFGPVDLAEHPEDNAADSEKKAVKERAVMQEEGA